MREGVSASCVAVPPGLSATVLDFLAQRLRAVPRQEWLQRLLADQVLDENGQPLSAHAPVQSTRRIYYYRELAGEPTIPFSAEVIFQDAHLLVADKPHFLPVTPSGRFVRETLLVRLKQTTGLEDLSPIHRIDRETAGLVAFSVRSQDRGAYQALFRSRQVHKVYEAIAPLRPDLPLPERHRSRIEADTAFYRQREVPGEPNSETRIELLESRHALARYRLEPLSGKTHQLRVHMQALGRAIVGDRFYPEVRHAAGEDGTDFRQPLQLLAKELSFTDPITGQTRYFVSRRVLRLDACAQDTGAQPG